MSVSRVRPEHDKPICKSLDSSSSAARRRATSILSTKFDDDGNTIPFQCDEMMHTQYQISMTSLTRYECGRYSNSYWKGKMVEIAVCRAANGSVWVTSHPFASLLCKPWFPRLLICAVISLLISLSAYLSLILKQNLIEGYRFRYSTIDARGGSNYSISPGIKQLGFLKNGCGDDFTNLQYNMTQTGRLLTLSFEHPIIMNGWWFKTDQQPIEFDPIVFQLEYSRSLSGNDWHIISSSSWIWTWSGVIKWGSEIFPTTIERGAAVIFDLNVPWVWTLHRISCNLTIIIMVILVLFAGYIKHHLKGKWIVIIFCSINATLNGAACVIYLCNAQWQVAFVAAGFFILDWGIPAVLYSAERILRIWVGIVGLGYPTIILVHYFCLVKDISLLAGDSGLGLMRNMGFTEGLGYFGLFFLIRFTRNESRKNAANIIKQDWEAYDICWRGLCSDVNNDQIFKEMYEFTDAICSRLPCTVKQPKRGTFAVYDEMDQEEIIGGYESFEDGYLIHRLEQLFAQAAGLDIFLRSKVQEWALKSNGCFWESGEIKRIDLIMEQGNEFKIEWARLKTLDRALEKVYRSYDLNASRLVDCCRQSIYFENVAGLFHCLRMICSDGSIKLARVCNRLHAAYDTTATAGYRDVLLNLSISNESTRNLQIDGVICELQLTLIDFARIKVYVKRLDSS